MSRLNLYEMKIILLLSFVLSTVVIITPLKAQDQNTQGENIDTVNSLSPIVVDTTNQNDKMKIAKDLAIDLMKRINLTMEQTTEITYIINDYQDEISQVLERKKSTYGADSAGIEYRDEVDSVEGELLDNRQAIENEVDALRGEPNIETALQEIDENTNESIEELLDDDQLEAYLFVKKDWWQKVKTNVYDTSDKDNRIEFESGNDSLQDNQNSNGIQNE